MVQKLRTTRWATLGMSVALMSACAATDGGDLIGGGSSGYGGSGSSSGADGGGASSSGGSSGTASSGGSSGTSSSGGSSGTSGSTSGGTDGGSDASSSGAINPFTGAGSYTSMPPSVTTGSHPGGNPAGTSCLGCHANNNKKFVMGGTIYRNAGRTMPAANIQVRLRDSTGAAYSVWTDPNGNFWEMPTVPTDYAKQTLTGMRNASTTKNMVAAITSGDCNACHNASRPMVMP